MRNQNSRSTRQGPSLYTYTREPDREHPVTNKSLYKTGTQCIHLHYRTRASSDYIRQEPSLYTYTIEPEHPVTI